MSRNWRFCSNPASPFTATYRPCFWQDYADALISNYYVSVLCPVSVQLSGPDPPILTPHPDSLALPAVASRPDRQLLLYSAASSVSWASGRGVRVRAATADLWAEERPFKTQQVGLRRSSFWWHELPVAGWPWSRWSPSAGTPTWPGRRTRCERGSQVWAVGEDLTLFCESVRHRVTHGERTNLSTLDDKFTLKSQIKGLFMEVV